METAVVAGCLSSLCCPSSSSVPPFLLDWIGVILCGCAPLACLLLVLLEWRFSEWVYTSRFSFIIKRLYLPPVPSPIFSVPPRSISRGRGSCRPGDCYVRLGNSKPESLCQGTPLSLFPWLYWLSQPLVCLTTVGSPWHPGNSPLRIGGAAKNTPCLPVTQPPCYPAWWPSNGIGLHSASCSRAPQSTGGGRRARQLARWSYHRQYYRGSTSCLHCCVLHHTPSWLCVGQTTLAVKYQYPCWHAPSDV